MSDLSRQFVVEHLERMKQRVARDEEDLKSPNGEIRRGAATFKRHHEFQMELARGYIAYLDSKVGVKDASALSEDDLQDGPQGES